MIYTPQEKIKKSTEDEWKEIGHNSKIKTFNNENEAAERPKSLISEIFGGWTRTEFIVDGRR